MVLRLVGRIGSRVVDVFLLSSILLVELIEAEN